MSEHKERQRALRILREETRFNTGSPCTATGNVNAEFAWDASADCVLIPAEEYERLKRLDTGGEKRPEGQAEQWPVAWRYRYKGTSDYRGEWYYVTTYSKCNLLPIFEREPLYAHPFLNGIHQPEQKKEGGEAR